MRNKHRLALALEQCEERILNTLVFVLNGNAFSAANPCSLTANAAQVLQQAGDRAVQLSYPTIATPAALNGCDRASAKDFHEIRAVFTRGVA
jgi:hypothetical protein